MMGRQSIYKKFAAARGGIIFIKRYALRVEAAARVIRYFKKEWDFVAWMAPANYLDIPDYVEKVKSVIGIDAAKIKFFSHEDISLNDQMYIELYDLADENRVFCVIDESLSIKNTSSGRTRRLLAMQGKFKYRLLMSKSPICRGLRDIYSQMQFMDSTVLGMTETQFLHQFMPFYTDDNAVSKRWSLPHLEKKAALLLKPYILFCDFKDNLKIVHREYQFELDAAEKEVYREDKESFLKNKSSVAYLQVIQRFQYYYTICRQKVEQLRRLLSEISSRKEKVVIYTKYLSEIKFLRESGLLKDSKYVIMSGTTNKIKAATLFEMDFNIMICTYKVEMPRLILQGCGNVIYFSQTFDYKDKMYALSRFYGEKELHLNVYDFWVNTRLEALIKDNLSRKKKVLQNMCKIMSYDEACNL